MNFSFPAKVTRIVDGDTVDLFAGVTFRLRLIDCWAPERHSEEGRESTEALGKLLPVGSYCDVVLDLSRCKTLADLFSFGRVLGRIRTDSYGDISDRMCESHFASPVRNR